MKQKNLILCLFIIAEFLIAADVVLGLAILDELHKSSGNSNAFDTDFLDLTFPIGAILIIHIYHVTSTKQIAHLEHSIRRAGVAIVLGTLALTIFRLNHFSLSLNDRALILAFIGTATMNSTFFFKRRQRHQKIHPRNGPDTRDPYQSRIDPG